MQGANRIEMTGRKFGRLTVIGLGPIVRPYKRTWICVCDCGNQIAARGEALRSGNTQSCGCKARESIARACTTHGHARRGQRDRAYKTWQKMLRRCLTKTDAAFHRYGGKGITVCERWLQFENFLADMGQPPQRHSIDRIDGTKGYSPENCRWATSKEQAVNRCSTVFVEHNGERLCAKDWARKLNIRYSTLLRRINAGWPVDKALTP